jgi:hypothetical protein
MPEIALSTLLRAGTTLMRAARWDDATQLLSAADTADPAERLRITAAQAEIAVDQDFAQQTDTARETLQLLEKALAESPESTISWDLEFLKLRKDYAAALFAKDDTADPANHADRADHANDATLADRGEQLRSTAPDTARAGHAAFYVGLIADNLRDLTAEGFAAFADALELGQQSGDELLESLALRHLGGHAHTAGDLQLARSQWERSTELRQKTGHLFGVLAQQALLAVLANDEGRPTASTALATEIHRWSTQLHLPALMAQAGTLMKAPGAAHQAD